MKNVLLLSFLSILLFSCKQEEKKYSIEDELKIDSIKTAIMKEAEESAYKESESGWKYKAETNKMTNTKDIFCTVQSNESLNLKFPYNGVNYGSLTVRKMNGKTNILISVMKGQITGEYENEYFKAKFDNDKQITFSYASTSDG
jgi:hypothetical protein